MNQEANKQKYLENRKKKQSIDQLKNESEMIETIEQINVAIVKIVEAANNDRSVRVPFPTETTKAQINSVLVHFANHGYLCSAQILNSDNRLFCISDICKSREQQKEDDLLNKNFLKYKNIFIQK